LGALSIPGGRQSVSKKKGPVLGKGGGAINLNILKKSKKTTNLITEGFMNRSKKKKKKTAQISQSFPKEIRIGGKGKNGA